MREIVHLFLMIMPGSDPRFTSCSKEVHKFWAPLSPRRQAAALVPWGEMNGLLKSCHYRICSPLLAFSPKPECSSTFTCPRPGDQAMKSLNALLGS